MRFIPIILLALTQSVFAADCTQDHWLCQDKASHALISAGIAAAATTATKSEWEGFAVAAAVGAAKEGYDYYHRPKHDPSWKDFGADCLGGLIGAKVAGLWITREDGGTKVSYSRSF